MAAEMTPVEVEQRLAELAADLVDAGLAADMYLVGGAAMSIGYFPNRRLTTDVDAKIADFDRLTPFVERIAQTHRLNPDWLNTSAAKLIGIAADDRDWQLWLHKGDVRIFIASAELLLAMKVTAARPKRDMEDIAVLAAHPGIQSWSQIEYIFEHYFPGDLPSARAESLVREFLQLSD